MGAIRLKFAGSSVWAWGVFAAGLLCVPVAYLVLSRNDAAQPPMDAQTYAHEAAQKGITTVEHDVAGVKNEVVDVHNDLSDMDTQMNQRFNAEDKVLRKVQKETRNIRQTMDKQSTQIQGLQEKADAHELELRQLAAINAFHQKLNEDKMAQVQYATALTAANTMPKNGEDSHPRSFSYFSTDEWEQQLESMDAWSQSVGSFSIINKGTENKDAVHFPAEKELVLDGYVYRKIEGYDLTNGHPNSVTVLAPGLMGLKDDTMQIDGDATLDSVTLDGCLKWQQTKKDNKYVYWKAMDVEKTTRTVLIGNGIPTVIESTCDNRYLLRRQQKGAAKLWTDPTVTRHVVNLKDMDGADRAVVPPN